MEQATQGDVDRYATSLTASPSSARMARRFLRARLDAAGVAGPTIDDAELLVSELVTNAVVHAGSDIALAVSVFTGAVRVEVKDGSSAHPVVFRAPDTSTTGRGWDLVRSLADAYGVSDSDAGKVTWFSLGPAPALEPTADRGVPPDGMGRHDGAVVLSDVPAELFHVWRQHAASAVREMTLLGYGHADAPTGGEEWSVLRRQADEAVGALLRAEVQPHSPSDDPPSDPASVDAALSRTPDLPAQFSALPRVLDESVTLARRGTLLVPPAPPEVIAFRDWVCEEVVRQCRGGEAVPWPQAPRRTRDVEVPQVEWDVTDVTASSASLVAADDTNRILAVSPSAAALLGWAPEDLVGRRITTIIPDRLHSAHVVGFLRFLLTGAATIVGSTVTVPARRSDGSEVPVDISISPLPRQGGRTVFVAELTPRQPSDGSPA